MLGPVRRDGPKRAEEQRRVGLARQRVGQQLPEGQEEELYGEAEPAAVTKVLQTPQLLPQQAILPYGCFRKRFKGLERCLVGILGPPPSDRE